MAVGLLVVPAAGTVHAAGLPVGSTGKIVFLGEGELVTVDPVTGALRRLTHDGYSHQWPVWSPEGRQIVFAAPADGQAATAPDAFLISAEGRARRRLTRGGSAAFVSWFPDGSRLLVTNTSGRRSDIDIVNADGRGRRPLFSRSRGRYRAIFSPDGQWIAYGRRSDRFVWISDAAGRTERRLAEGEFMGWLPSARGVVVSGRGLKFVSLSGRVLRTILPAADPVDLTLAPDGRQVAYTASTDEDDPVDRLFVSSLAGAAPRDLSQGMQSDQPDWQSRCTISGTERVDRLVGTRAADKICGLGGDDIVIGRGGDDVIIGGDGDDCIDGGAGNDWLFGSSGNDTINARYGGYDTLNGGPGADTAASDGTATDRTQDLEEQVRRASCP